MKNTTITGIPGILAGHANDSENSTGCTAVLCPEGFTPGIAVPGFAPGSRETDLMRPEATVDSVHGLLFSGGSAFGLAAADGVVRFLRERKAGFQMPHAVIPLVPAAVIYDLDVNVSPGFLPDAETGYTAAFAAWENEGKQLAGGRVGAGCGARCGRLFDLLRDKGDEQVEPPISDEDRQQPGGSRAGLGNSLLERNGLLVGALAVVNPLGNVHDPATGAFLEGGRDAEGRPLDGEALWSVLERFASPNTGRTPNTMLVAVVTNVPLSKTQASRLARMSAAGIARCIFPAHLILDGDMVFALASKRPLPESCGPWSEEMLGVLGAQAVTAAILDAVIGG